MIALTSGDPCGIGPEVVLKAFLASPLALRRQLLVIGNLAVFQRTAHHLRLRLPSWQFVDCPTPGRFTPGKSSRDAGRAALTYLNTALGLWRAGRISGLVTAPVTKWSVAMAQPGFIGHTEYLAEAMRVRDVAMMFISDRLRVSLVTRHVPLGRVPQALTSRRLAVTIRLTDAVLAERFRIRRPRLAVCGLNPHAGEAGRCGSEERDRMIPVLQRLRRDGIRCEGPLAADGLFAGPIPYDAVICAYHDQGLIPFKALARDRGCQLSAGLPLVRTSPDHGSGLDIAGKGLAHPGSMRYALELAARLSR